VWPRDEVFQEHWLSTPSYQRLGSFKTQHVLRCIEERLRGRKSEIVEIKSDLSVEHVLPNEWIDNWPLPNGRKGIGWLERFDEGADKEDVNASASRDQLLHSFGNLTLLTMPLNSSISNSAFSIKRPEILKHSALALNRYFQDKANWDEKAIAERGNELFGIAKEIWPYGV
jgi:hypothetical protein